MFPIADEERSLIVNIMYRIEDEEGSVIILIMRDSHNNMSQIVYHM